ncbi:hypothetical protein [Streptomyces chrestomyceticus]|uniref:Secreted protein n=1 Tax=Streptomyces chrestomyceticus TaxID=68185 RepID=A0ABU7X1N5_9ACTN
MKQKSLRLSVISAVCAAAVGLTGIGSAHAAATGDARTVAAVASAHGAGMSEAGDATPEQIDELARYLQAIVEGEILGSDGKFDYAKTRAQFGAEFADALAAEFNKENSGRQKRSYTSCLLNAVGAGGLGSATNAIVDKLKNKKWADAARLITKEAAKRGIKIAVKGGVAGMAATLAASAIICIWQG